MDQTIKIRKTEVLSDNWALLNQITYDYKKKNGNWETVTRESYDTGDGATVLLFNPKTKNIVLTRQFRLPTYLNGNKGGILTEACAGLLDQDSPEECVVSESLEETGYRITKPKKVFEAYMCPGSVTELMHFFIAEYSGEKKVAKGGGLDEEQEEIEVIELDFEKALKMISTGEIKDAKTIMLLQYLKLQNII